jgi:probable addiction module antidote protein
MAKLKTSRYDAADYLRTNAQIEAYLEAAMEDGDPRVITMALNNVARAKGMSRVARAAGISREGLYKALSSEGNPEFATILKVIRALGLKIEVRPT